MEGIWLQLLRSCTFHLLQCSGSQSAEIKLETEWEYKLIEDEVKKNRNKLINIQTEVTKWKWLHFYTVLDFQLGAKETQVNELGKWAR